MTTISPAEPQPGHVPDEAVYDFDMHLDPELLRDPHARVLQMLRDAPKVFWTPRNGGHWVALGHRDAFDALRDTETFSSELFPREQIEHFMAMLPPGAPHFPTPTPINLDPPHHTKFRLPLNPAFSPKAMNVRKEEIRALANDLIDRVIEQGHCDFIHDIAEPLPVQVFLKLMGLPLDRQGRFRDLVHEFLAPQTSPMDIVGRMRSVVDSMTDVIEARRTDPKDDLISLLWRTEIDGAPMTMDLMEDYCILLFIAGLDTVINGLGHGVRHFAMHPELQAQLRANPALIPEAAEELLRRYSFVAPVRRLAKDTELGGRRLKQGDKVILYLPAADLDEREFAQPEKFDLDRPNKVHAAFGVGPHRCLGSHLARLELQIVYEQMLARLPAFRVDPDKATKFHAGPIIAIDALPLRWD